MKRQELILFFYIPLEKTEATDESVQLERVEHGSTCLATEICGSGPDGFLACYEDEPKIIGAVEFR